MSVECKIGPIELDAAQLVDGDVNERSRSLDRYLSPGGRRITQGLRDKNEGFAIFCKKYQALQVSGLADWKELEWIDSSSSLINNDDIVHRGWGVLGKTNLLVYPGEYCDMDMEVAILSPNENETLLMDIVSGVYSQLIEGYEGYVKEYIVKDDFSTFDTGVWESYHTHSFNSYSVAAAGGNLTFTGQLAPGYSGGRGLVMIPTVLEAPFTVKANLSNIHNFATPAPSPESDIQISIVVWKPDNYEAWKTALINDTPYIDDFEDGKYTGRSAPYINWTTLAGTPGIETTNPITGSYSLKHTGAAGNTNISNGLKAAVTYPHRVKLKFKLKTRGVGLYTPYAFIWTPRYMDDTNNLTIDTSYDGTDQKIRLIKWENNNPTAISNVTWFSGSKAPEGITWEFIIIDTGSNIKVYIDGVKYIDTNYTTTVSSGYSRVGANMDSVGVWDQISISPASEVSISDLVNNGVDVRTRGHFLISGVQAAGNGGNWTPIEIQGWPLSNFIRYNMRLDQITMSDHEIKVKINEEGIFSFYLDGTLVHSGPIQVPLTGGFVAGILFAIIESAESKRNYSLHALDFEAYMEKPFPQQVILPPTSNPFETPSSYRKSRFGNLPVFQNPPSGVEFPGDPESYFTGGPFLWSSENESGVKRQVFNPDEVLTPTTFELENGIIKITTENNRVKLYGYNGNGESGAWVLSEEISIGNESIDLVKIEEINREIVVLRINRTTWTIRRGDPVVKIDHQYNDLGMLLGTSYYHDGTTTTNPATGADITMQTQSYCLKTTSNSLTNMKTLLIQTTPTTIKSDKIPATQNTGIGVYDPNETPTDPSGYIGLTGWFVNRGRQKIKLA